MRSKIENMNESLRRAMTADILGRAPARTGSILNSGWKTVPSIKKFKHQPSIYNSLLEMIKIYKRTPGQVEIELNKNKSMNRYMKHQIMRLDSARSNPKLYWRIAMHILHSSNSFRMSALYNRFPNWWREVSQREIISILTKVERIIREGVTQVDFKRVYIPKADGKPRPLGVPTSEWRIVSHMWSNLITFYLKGQLTNHAYQPGKGTTTALSEMTRIKNYRYIYEFDLKGFFDNVDIYEVSKALIERNIPHEIVKIIQSMNWSTPKLPSKELMDERKTKKRISLKAGKWSPKQTLKDFLESMDVSGNRTSVEGLKYNEIEGIHTKGLPQGLNTSPILSILQLQEWTDRLEKKGINSLLYADDGILYSDRPFTIEPPKGIAINKEKSRWLRKEEWGTKVIRFLGVDWNIETDRFSGHTRKGSRLEFDSNHEEMIALLKTLNKNYEKGEMELLVGSGLWGYTLSKLYGGSWYTEDHIEKEKPVHPESWYAKTKGVKTLENILGTLIDKWSKRGKDTESSIAGLWIGPVSKRIITKKKDQPEGKNRWEIGKLNAQEIKSQVGLIYGGGIF